jgi:small subunit ribosomal protein S1
MANATSMAELLAAQKQPLVTFKKGDVIQGTISKLSKQEILVSIGAKGEALVMEKDPGLLSQLLEMVQVGDRVDVSIISPEAENGYTIVSLRRFMDQKIWDKLTSLQKEKTLVDVTVFEVTKGGYSVRTADGIQAFLPHTLTTKSHTQGETVAVTVFELIREDKKVVVSEKSMMTADEFKKLKSEVKVGQLVKATVTNVTTFGIFATVPVTVGGETKSIEALIHISEIAWEKTMEIDQQAYGAGSVIEAKVVGYDDDSKRLSLSLKQLTEDPFTKVASKYPLDTTVSGTVSQIQAGNVHIALGEGIEGIIRKEKVPAGTEYTEGQTLSATVSEIDTRRHKLYLSPVLLKKTIGYR